MRDELATQNSQFMENTKDMTVTDTWSIFEELLKRLMNQHIPSKMLSGNKVHTPWITKAVKALHRKRNELFARQKVTGKSKDRHTFIQAKATSQRLER
ncbi:hypothetical protein DPMN_074188 [Dreissena polymorpha]|uniref:Uncharacterized protein n=1 Tax=Dreissena polymorpha TaxID=45954 RepID=A0A9D3YEH8_DREPO|nr:hypothetical protein DPMN_074188 [Dreissena polymorpha]